MKITMASTGFAALLTFLNLAFALVTTPSSGQDKFSPAIIQKYKDNAAAYDLAYGYFNDIHTQGLGTLVFGEQALINSALEAVAKVVNNCAAVYQAITTAMDLPPDAGTGEKAYNPEKSGKCDSPGGIRAEYTNEISKAQIFFEAIPGIADILNDAQKKALVSTLRQIATQCGDDTPAGKPVSDASKGAGAKIKLICPEDTAEFNGEQLVDGETICKVLPSLHASDPRCCPPVVDGTPAAPAPGCP